MKCNYKNKFLREKQKKLNLVSAFQKLTEGDLTKLLSIDEKKELLLKFIGWNTHETYRF